MTGLSFDWAKQYFKNVLTNAGFEGGQRAEC